MKTYLSAFCMLSIMAMAFAMMACEDNSEAKEPTMGNEPTLATLSFQLSVSPQVAELFDIIATVTNANGQVSQLAMPTTPSGGLCTISIAETADVFPCEVDVQYSIVRNDRLPSADVIDTQSAMDISINVLNYREVVLKSYPSSTNFGSAELDAEHLDSYLQQFGSVARSLKVSIAKDGMISVKDL